MIANHLAYIIYMFQVAEGMKRELDTADRKIVELLQEDARLPLKSIADKVSLTSPTVSARIDRLEKDGVITGYRASVNPEVFDYRIKAFINLEVEPVQQTGKSWNCCRKMQGFR